MNEKEIILFCMNCNHGEGRRYREKASKWWGSADYICPVCHADTSWIDYVGEVQLPKKKKERQVGSVG